MSTETTTMPIPTAPEISTLENDIVNNRQTSGCNRSEMQMDATVNTAEPTTTTTTVATLTEATATTNSNKSICSSSSATAYSFTASDLSQDATTNANAETNANSSSNTTENDNRNSESFFECNICLDTAKDAVVSMCGHLFCWPCLHQWLETRPLRKICPVCKSAISKEKVIPLYGRNSTQQTDPRNKVPPRPAGQRTEPDPQHGFQGLSFGEGFHMSFGIGAFPFGYFASSFNFGEPRPAAANRGTTQYQDEQQLSKLFLYFAFLCIAWLVFA